jgi:hypothetical protein
MKNDQKTHTQLNSLQEYEFSKTAVLAGIVHTTELIALKPICENLGLDWVGQYQRLKRNELLSQLCVSEKSIGKDGKSYEMVCLPPSAFQDWLYSLNDAESQKLNRELLMTYQKGLVIHLLMMLKISLDEIHSLRNIKILYREMNYRMSKMIELDETLSSAEQNTRMLRKKKKQAIEGLKSIGKIDPAQSALEFNFLNN